MADQIINVNCGFFDSINEDRLYAASQMNNPYKRLVSNGVFATPQGTPSTDLQVFANGEDMDIVVKKGNGIFADKWFENPSDKSFTIPNNTEIVPRIDSVIAQVDNTQAGRVGNIVYRTGEPASNPQAPTINSNVNIVEYRLANIYVGSGVTSITQSKIIDFRGSSECPWVTSLVQQVDTSELFRQYQDWFNERKQQAEDDFDDFEEEQEALFTTWFNEMKDQLSEDAAGNLQNEIDELDENKYDKTEVYNKEEIDEQNEAFALKSWVEGTVIHESLGMKESFMLLHNPYDYKRLKISGYFLSSNSKRKFSQELELDPNSVSSNNITISVIENVYEDVTLVGTVRIRFNTKQANNGLIPVTIDHNYTRTFGGTGQTAKGEMYITKIIGYNY